MPLPADVLVSAVAAAVNEPHGVSAAKAVRDNSSARYAAGWSSAAMKACRSLSDNLRKLTLPLGVRGETGMVIVDLRANSLE